MIETLTDERAAVVLTGAVAASLLTLSPLLRARGSILLAQLGAGIGFAAHYLCLGAPVAAVANVLGVAQTGAALLSPRSATMARLGYGLIAVMGAAGVWLWEGPVSALSMAAMASIALGRMQRNELRLRLLLLAGGGFWIAHDLIVAAWIALAADIGAVLTGVAMLGARFLRIRIEWRPQSAVAVI